MPMRGDYRLLLSIRLLRSFGFGFVPVLLGLRFEQRGLGAGPLGAALSIGVLAAALSGLPLAALASKIGRRWVLFATGLLMAITGADLALASAAPGPQARPVRGKHRLAVPPLPGS